MLKAELGGENIFRHLLKGKQADGLALQFVDAALAAFTGRLKNVNDGSGDRVSGMQPAQHQGNGDSGGMRRDLRPIVIDA